VIVFCKLTILFGYKTNNYTTQLRLSTIETNQSVKDTNSTIKKTSLATVWIAALAVFLSIITLVKTYQQSPLQDNSKQDTLLQKTLPLLKQIEQSLINLDSLIKKQSVYKNKLSDSVH